MEQNSSTTKNKVPQPKMGKMVNLAQMSGIIPSPDHQIKRQSREVRRAFELWNI